jgi:hypothetical protein
MLVLSRTGLWHRRGQDPVAIRYVLSRDPEGEQPDAAYLCTDDRVAPEEILKYVVQRWSLEVTFEEARAHLGLETQRQWSDLVIDDNYTSPRIDSLILLPKIACCLT